MLARDRSRARLQRRCRAEVGELEVPIGVENQVLRFDVTASKVVKKRIAQTWTANDAPVCPALCVHPLDRIDQLRHPRTYPVLRQPATPVARSSVLFENGPEVASWSVRHDEVEGSRAEERGDEARYSTVAVVLTGEAKDRDLVANVLVL